MSLLADANNSSPGRWVLMPRKGQRFVGSRDRGRVRARRRRRQIFMVLLESTALTLMMGVFPPFRVMLYGTGILGFLLLAYSALLVKIREVEQAAAHRRAAFEQSYAAQFEDAPTAAARYAAVGTKGRVGSNGHANAHSNGNGHANGNGHPNGNGTNLRSRVQRATAPWPATAHSNGNGNGKGHSNGNGHRVAPEVPAGDSRDGLQLIDDDLHIVIGRIEDFGPDVARSASR
jgi:hypothetical protein